MLMEFPTIDKFAKDVAEKALDEITYEGKTIREWVEILVKQPHCEDCISRESLRQKFQEHRDFFVNTFGCFKNMNYIDKARVDEIDSCMAMVVNAPSVTPQQTRWIPVSERLPEIHQDVLLSLRSLDIEVGFRAVTERYFCCHDADGAHYIEPQNVLAWQPLPEPYKAESEDKE